MKSPILINSPYILPDLCPSHWVSSFRIFYHLCPPAPPPRRSRSARRAPEPPDPPGEGGTASSGAPSRRGHGKGGGGSSFQLLLCSVPPHTHTFFYRFFPFLQKTPAAAPRRLRPGKVGGSRSVLRAAPSALPSSRSPTCSRLPTAPPCHPPALPAAAVHLRGGGVEEERPRQTPERPGVGFAPSPTASPSPSDCGWAARGAGERRRK